MPSSETDESSSAARSRGTLEIAGDTHVGCVRSVNQDAFGHFVDAGRRETLLVVADGLGGHRGGEVASWLAVETLGEHIQHGDGSPDERLHDAIDATNRAILEAARKDHALDGMGTTVVCLLLTDDGRSFVGHVGDSRLYRLRSGRLEAMTEDHSLVATLVREGILTSEEAWSDPRRNQIMQALGIRERLEIEIAPIGIQPGDSYLLCSDGLNGMIEDPDIRNLVSRPERLEKIVDELIQAALHAGGTDNITCMLARFREPTAFPALREGATRLIEKTRSLLRPSSSR